MSDSGPHGAPSWLLRVLRSSAVAVRAGPVTVLWRRGDPSRRSEASRVRRPLRPELALVGWAYTGAALATLLYQYAETAYHERGMVSFGLSLLVGAIFVNFVEPEMRRRFSGHVPVPDNPPAIVRLRLGSLVLGAVMGLTFELMHSAVSHNPRLFLRSNLALFIECGAVTYGWARGAWAPSPRATLYGALGGAVGGLVAGGAREVVLVALTHEAWSELPAPFLLAEAAARLVEPTIAWMGYGLVGGYLIDRPRFRRWVRPSMTPAIAIVTVAVLGEVIALVVRSPAGLSSTGFLSSTFFWGKVAIGVGWALGLFLYRRSDELLTATVPRAADAPLAWPAPALLGLMLGLLVVVSDVLPRWFPPPAPLFVESFEGPGRWTSVPGGSACTRHHVAHTGPLSLADTNGQCEVALRLGEDGTDGSPPTLFPTPLVIGIDLSAELKDRQDVGLVFWDAERRFTYSVWIAADGLRLVGHGEAGFDPVRFLPIEWEGRPPRLRFELEVIGGVARVHLDGAPVRTFARRKGAPLVGEIRLVVRGRARVDIHEFRVDPWVPSLTSILKGS